MKDESSENQIWFFLAMAHHCRHSEQFRSLLSKAIEQLDAEFAAAAGGSWNRDLTLRLLRQEAENLLQDEQGRNATESRRGEASP